MSVSDGYRQYVLEQLGRVTPVTAKRMFGGVGIYANGLFIGVMDDDMLYLKVDDGNRADFEAIGSRAFQPMPDKSSMNYFELPADRLEDVDELRGWVHSAMDAAARSKVKKKR